jgi:hypothetical protein
MLQLGRAFFILACFCFAQIIQLKSNLGWGERAIMPENIRMQGINGGTGGYGASILVNREKDCSVVVLSNIWPWHYMEIIYPLGKELLIEASAENPTNPT